MPRCANCHTALDGPYCSQCGQHATDLHRPFRQWMSQLIDDAFSLDTRLVRTLRPLLFRPGAVTADYLAGRRVAYVPPLRSYLIAALIFFGLFTLFPVRGPVTVFMAGEKVEVPRGPGLSFELPAHLPLVDERYQEAAASAKKNPQEFARVLGTNMPRTFFLLLPIFALLLELFYRRQGYYLDHLVFSLYYHAYVFVVLAVMFVVARSDWMLPRGARAALGMGLLVWLVAYLPLALRRVYGGSWKKTLLKLASLGVLYFFVFFVIVATIVMYVLLSTF